MQKPVFDQQLTVHARRKAHSLQRCVSHTAAARVNSMESEKLYLQNLHGAIGEQWRSIGDRIAALDRQIAAEKASVANGTAMRHTEREE